MTDDWEKIKAASASRVQASYQKLVKAQEAFRAHRAQHDDDIGLGTYKPSGPYPSCHHPEKCNLTGRCPRDPVCYN